MVRRGPCVKCRPKPSPYDSEAGSGSSSLTLFLHACRVLTMSSVHDFFQALYRTIGGLHNWQLRQVLSQVSSRPIPRWTAQLGIRTDGGLTPAERTLFDG